MTTTQGQIGSGVARLEGSEKVTGQARYTADHHLDGLTYAWIVLSSIAKGRITAVHADPVLAMPGVLSVLHHGNAPRITDPGDPVMLLDESRPPAVGDATLMVLQDDIVHHYG